ncbi:MAG: FHA domain-containing protein [Lentisphaerae bacterium]|nr:FHA domain-containing protein [Lentisphaerota bacterium]
MRFTISEINQPLRCVSFDTAKYPDTRALSVGRSSGCVFSLKNLSWVSSQVGRTHFSLLRSGDSWVALASSENHQLLYEGTSATRVELQQPGCKFQFGNCLFTVDAMESPNKASSNFLLQVSEGGSSRMFPIPDGGSISIGREGSDCDVTLQTRYCSRTHAIIRNQGEEVHLEDVSTNGTTVGNRLLKNASMRIKPGQVINIDSAKLQVLEVNASPKAFKMIHLLLILLVGAIGVLLAVQGLEDDKPPNGGTSTPSTPVAPVKPPSRDSLLAGKLGAVYLRDFYVLSGLDSMVINNMAEHEFNKLLDDSAMWKHLHLQLEELENRKNRLLQITNEQWPLPDTTSPGNSSAPPDLTALEQGIKRQQMFSLREPLLTQLVQLKNSWQSLQTLEEKLRQAHQLFQQKKLEDFQKLKQELASIDELAKNGKTWKKLLLAEKILEITQQVALAEKEFSSEMVNEISTRIQDRLKTAADLLEELSDDVPDKKQMSERQQKLWTACQNFDTLQKFSFYRLEPAHIREFDQAKNAALVSELPVLVQLAIEKTNSCLQNFDYYVNSLDPQKNDLTWDDVERAGNILSSLHLLTANIPESGRRKQEIDTALRNKIDSMQQELNKILLGMQKIFLEGGRKNRELLLKMLPLADPKGRWRLWIDKQLQQLPQ